MITPSDSRPRHGTWLSAIWGIATLGSIVAVFIGTRVAPCLGGVGPEGQAIRDRCVAAWLAERSWLDGFTAETPSVIVVILALAIIGTALVLRRTGPWAWLAAGLAMAVLIGALGNWPDSTMDQLRARCGAYSGGGPDGNPDRPAYCDDAAP